MPTDGAGTTLIKDDTSIAVIDTTSNHRDGKTLQQIRCQATTYVVEANDNLKEGPANAPIFDEFLQQQATVSFCQQTATQVEKAKAEYTIGKNRLVV